ncbi:MAG: FAD:protein FMN transferase [Oscillatoriaceae cyanobacterium Prado104]|jgi:thiamine biosynthesis lipoprotein|nr:FAD:protein FMN transferase [Oscillatoriaceae cyanobacterium Prado104]
MNSIARRKVLMASAGAIVMLCGRGLINRLGGKQTSFIPWEKTGLKLVRDTSYAMGTNVSITAVHEDVNLAKSAIAAALREVHRIEQLMSIYRPESQVSQLNRQGWLELPHPDLVKVLHGAQNLSELSGGAFDITVQPLWEACAQAEKLGKLPEGEVIDRARQLVNWNNLEVSAKRIQFIQSGMAITLNGIAQGFASDRVLAVLKNYGIENALLDTGEIGSWGQKAAGIPWKIGIQNPRQMNANLGFVQPQNQFIATSGDYATKFSEDCINHHIFDPHTGKSPQEFSSVTVLASSGMEADGLSTAAFVLGAEKGLALIKSIPQAGAIATLKNGLVLATDNFPLISDT